MDKQFNYEKYIKRLQAIQEELEREDEREAEDIKVYKEFIERLNPKERGTPE